MPSPGRTKQSRDRLLVREEERSTTLSMMGARRRLLTSVLLRNLLEAELFKLTAPSAFMGGCFANCRHYSLFVANRRDKQYEFLDSKYPRDLEVKWRPTADRVVQYATSYFCNCVVWEGKVEDYMLLEWKDKDYCKNRRDAICLALLNSKDYNLFSEVNEAATKWNH
ncbi:hypothetical protein LINPERHAP2_LOCUS23054 [Linum perenne]